MRSRIYTKEEITLLEHNPNVMAIKYKRQIEYNPEFKLKTVLMKRDYPQYSSKEIFKYFGMDTSLLDDRTPQKRISYWTKKFNMYGYDYFKSGAYQIDFNYLYRVVREYSKNANKSTHNSN